MTAVLGREPMQQALDLAARGRGRTSPNPTVGAVVVRDGEIVGEGFHIYKEMRHAEIVALEQAGERARGATIYTTLEPCSHQGRTGPCVEAIVKSGVKRVISAIGDPNPLVGGKGFAQLRSAGIAVDFAPEFSAQAQKLNEPFFHFIQRGRPLVTLKAALTLDGKIAAPEDNRGWITSELARAHVQQLRHESDAILTGIGTVLSDDCLLNDRSGLDRSRPLLRIVVDSQLRIPPNSRMVTSCREDLLVITTSAASAERRRTLEKLGVRILTLDGSMGRTNLQALVEQLAKEKYLSLMVEAGSKVNWSFLESGVVDKIYFYYAPKILGGMQSLPVAGGAGRLRRVDAIVLENVTVHPIAPDEFAVEAYLAKEQ